MDNQDAMPSLEETRINEGEETTEAIDLAKESLQAKPDVMALSEEDIQKGAAPTTEMTKEELPSSQKQDVDKRLKAEDTPQTKEALKKEEEPPKGFLGRFFQRFFLGEKSDHIRETV